ncbi:DDE-1 domain-containing protein [Trichoderma simmonsii]|uniref:DDE-1 domain-containing protein n=1 Tax=Trichoderma simmonsii TaxID=1491479 RepID=A0A8G0LLU0_9HYPO|nr:DDE-1 domain-containing protein [Trichoderma simmonsii]
MEEFPPAFRAAAAILEDRDRPLRDRKALSIRSAAAQFKTSPSAVQRAISSLMKPAGSDYRDPRAIRRPRSLSNDEDEALVAYVM